MKKKVPLPTQPLPSLEEIELEVEAEAREFGRRRLKERLQELADQQGEVFPPKRSTGARAASSCQEPAQPPRSD